MDFVVRLIWFRQSRSFIMQNCPNCGKELADDSKFCSECGTTITSPATVESKVPDTIKTSEDQSVSPKSRLAALLFGIFLGSFGVHNFYLGRIIRGVFQVILTVGGFAVYFFALFKTMFNTISNPSPLSMLSILPGLFAFIVMIGGVNIWALVEWILIACGKARDKEGRQVLIWTK